METRQKPAIDPDDVRRLIVRLNDLGSGERRRTAHCARQQSI